MPILFRELDASEIKRLLTPKKRKFVEPVLYRGYETKDTSVARYTLERTVRKIVNEQDAGILVRQGWVIVAIDDPDDD